MTTINIIELILNRQANWKTDSKRELWEGDEEKVVNVLRKLCPELTQEQLILLVEHLVRCDFSAEWSKSGIIGANH